jgi:hypothetical protein
MRYWLAVAVLIVTSAFLQLRSANQENQTWDEAMHLTAGFQYWRTGDFTRNWQHPPVAKLWAAIPLLQMDVELPKKDLDEVAYAREFLFANRTPYHQMLGSARMMMIVLSLLLIVAIAWFVARHFGAPAGLLAAALAALDPNLLAHGHYITTDVPNALFIFVTCAFWLEYLWKQRRWALIATGLVLGIALATKFSAVILPFLLILLYFLPGSPGRGVRHFAASIAVVAALSAITLSLSYLPGHRLSDKRTFAETVTSDTTVGKALRYVGQKFHLQPHPFLAGVDQVAEHNRSGHPSYLMGEVYDDGRWQYFPVAFGVKTPIATLALALLSLFFFRRDSRLLGLLIPFVAFFLFCASSRINLGLRHLLPVYPFLFAIIGACCATVLTRPRIAIIAVVLAVQVAEVARVHPHYLAFFNAAAGGPDAGINYLVDSNLDWGQDFDNLVRYVRRQGERRVCLLYFGSTSWETAKMNIDSVPKSDDLEAIEKVDCLVAVSATPLVGLYVPRKDTDWLRKMPVTTKIGWSIYVWDLRKHRAAAAQ